MNSLVRASMLAAVVGDKVHADGYQQQFGAPQRALLGGVEELRGLASGGENDALLQQLADESAALAQAHEELRQAIVGENPTPPCSSSARNCSRVSTASPSKRPPSLTGRTAS